MSFGLHVRLLLVAKLSSTKAEQKAPAHKSVHAPVRVPTTSSKMLQGSTEEHSQGSEETSARTSRLQPNLEEAKLLQPQRSKH